MELFKQVEDLQMTHVPYRGVAPAFTDLMGGQTQACSRAWPRRCRTSSRAACARWP
jgi:tripartite-type tricarboxylate transporter receptor subunit TctC